MSDQQQEMAVIADNRLIHGGAPDSLNQFFADIHTKRQQALAVANTSTPRTTKLSPLQKKILLIALRWRGKACSDVYSQDIKVEVFGLQPMRHYWSGWELNSSVQQGTARLSEDHPSMANGHYGGQIFNRQAIGHKTYNVVSVSVSRALKRLTERHLLYQSGAGWSLTYHGVELAKTSPASEHS